MDETLAYELGRADLEAFYAHHASHAPHVVARNRRMRLVWGALFTVLVLVMALRSPTRGAAFAGIAVVVLASYGRLNRWWYVRHNLRIGGGPDGPRLGAITLRLANDRLVIEASEGAAQLEPSAVRRIDESGSHYFLYLGPTSAIIVPRTGGRADRFIRALRALRGAGR